jgi:hypothetical protein
LRLGLRASLFGRTYILDDLDEEPPATPGAAQAAADVDQRHATMLAEELQ